MSQGFKRNHEQKISQNQFLLSEVKIKTTKSILEQALSRQETGGSFSTLGSLSTRTLGRIKNKLNY